jgi:transcriptional regulator with XRE-family HTH domain
MTTGHDLRIARQNAGVSLGWIAERTGLSRGHLSRIERGERDVTPSVIRQYQVALQGLALVVPTTVDPEVSGTRGRPENRGEERFPPVFGCGDGVMSGTAFDMEEWLLSMDRRSFNEMAVGLAATAVIPFAPDRVDSAHVRYLRNSLEQLRSGFRSAGGGTVLDAAVRQFAWARSLLENSSYTEADGGHLLEVAAELGEVAGWAAYDANRQNLARRIYTEAELLAGCTDRVGVRVHLYTNLAQQSTYLATSTGRRGLARESLRFADRAAAIARHEPSPRMHALIALRKARAFAELGDKSAFRSAITMARRELDRGTDETDTTWAFVTPSEITGQEGLGYQALARVRGEKLGQVPDLYRAVIDDPNRSPRDHVFYRARLAGALLEQGDIRHAISEAAAVLPENSQVISARSLRELRPLRAAAERISAEEFCVRYDAAMRSLSA